MSVESIEKKILLGRDFTDFLIIVLDFDYSKRKKLQGFCLTQIFYFEEKSIEIIKYDTAHNICHAHRYYRNKKDSKEILENKEINQETLIELKNDLINNWRKYKKLYLKKWLT